MVSMKRFEVDDDPRIENLQKTNAVLTEQIEQLRTDQEFYTSMHLWDLLLTAAIFGGVGLLAGLAFAARPF